MKILTIAIIIAISFIRAECDILHNDVLYFSGERVETTERDKKVSREPLKAYMKQRPNGQIYGYVTGVSVSKSRRHLLIRCVIRNKDSPISRVLGSLSVEYYNPSNGYYKSASLDYIEFKTFNVAIDDTIAANETRTYVFKQFIDFLEASNNYGLQMLWNRHRLTSDTRSFRWTFEPSYVRQFRNQ